MSESLFFLSESLVCSFAHKNEQFALKKTKKSYFCMFLQFLKKILKKQKILSFLLSQVSESLRLVRTNKRHWAICSGPSEGMSNCERIAQVAHQKWAKRSLLRKSLIRSLFLAKTMTQFPISQPCILYILIHCDSSCILYYHLSLW